MKANLNFYRGCKKGWKANWETKDVFALVSRLSAPSDRVVYVEISEGLVLF